MKLRANWLSRLALWLTLGAAVSLSGCRVTELPVPIDVATPTPFVLPSAVEPPAPTPTPDPIPSRCAFAMPYGMPTRFPPTPPARSSSWHSIRTSQSKSSRPMRPSTGTNWR